MHARLLFARSQLDEQLQGMVSKLFRELGICPSSCCMAIGGWARLIQCVTSSTSCRTTTGFNAQIVFVELPDITAKATFLIAHAALTEATTQRAQFGVSGRDHLGAPTRRLRCCIEQMQKESNSSANLEMRTSGFGRSSMTIITRRRQASASPSSFSNLRRPIACDGHVKLAADRRGSVHVFELAGKLIVADWLQARARAS